MTTRTFQCGMCNEVHETDTPEAEAMDEFLVLMPEAINDDPDDLASVCEECYEKFMQWFRTLSKEDKIKIRNAYRKEKYQS